MTIRWWHSNSAYDINVSHTVLAPETRASPTRNGDVEVEFVLEEFFLPDAQYDPSARTVTRKWIEAPFSDLPSLDVVSMNSTKLLLEDTMTNLLLPACCVQGELISQLTLEARDVELDLGSDPPDQVVFTVNITLNNYSSAYNQTRYQAALDESLQEDAASVRPFRATEESIKGLERFAIDEDDDQETCTVCMDAMESGDVQGARMPCGHIYHEHCIVKWLGESCSCPICRYQLPSYLT